METNLDLIERPPYPSARPTSPSWKREKPPEEVKGHTRCPRPLIIAPARSYLPISLKTRLSRTFLLTLAIRTSYSTVSKNLTRSQSTAPRVIPRGCSGGLGTPHREPSGPNGTRNSSPKSLDRRSETVVWQWLVESSDQARRESPGGRVPPVAFGISTLLTGNGL